MGINGVQHWEDMRRLWAHAVGSLRDRPAGTEASHGSRVLLTEPMANPKASRQKMMQVMFEELGFDAVAVASPATLTLFSQGESFAIEVLCCGPEMASCCNPHLPCHHPQGYNQVLS